MATPIASDISSTANSSADSPRIALFVPSLGYGGVERVMLLIAGGLADRGHRIDLVVANGAGEFSGRVPGNVRLVDLHGARVAATLPRLVSYLRRERPEVMISALTHSNALALMARKLAGATTRIIATEHAALSIIAAHTNRTRVKLMPLAARLLYSGADAVVGVSAGVAEDIRKVARLPHDRVRVIYNPVITHELRERSQAALDHPWFAAGEPPVLLAVGRLEAEKDFATLLRAFAQLRKRRPVRLLILGEGSQRQELETTARDLGITSEVAMPGFCDNPYPYMRGAALLALTSRWEGFGVVLVEALALGTAVVATDCPSGPREILQDGRLGRLVPVGDTAALAEAMEATLSQPPAPVSELDLRRFQLATAVGAYHDLARSLSGDPVR